MSIEIFFLVFSQDLDLPGSIGILETQFKLTVLKWSIWLQKSIGPKSYISYVFTILLARHTIQSLERSIIPSRIGLDTRRCLLRQRSPKPSELSSKYFAVDLFPPPTSMAKFVRSCLLLEGQASGHKRPLLRTWASLLESTPNDATDILPNNS